MPDEIQTMRVLLVSAPGEEAGAARSALEQSGLRIETVLVRDRETLSEQLRAPADLVLAWVPSASVSGPEAPSPEETVELLSRWGLRVPLYGVMAAGEEERGLRLLEMGAEGLIYRDRPAPLAAVASRVSAEARRRALVEMTRATSHDLNNLFAPVPLAAHILREQLADRSAEGFLGTVEGSVKQATAAVEALYRVALWSDPGPSGAGPTVRVHLRHLVESTARTVRDAFPAWIVETEYPSGLPPVEAAPDELAQILQRLVLGVIGDRPPAPEGAGEDAGRGTVRIAVRARSGSEREAGVEVEEVEEVEVTAAGPADPARRTRASDAPDAVEVLRSVAARRGWDLTVDRSAETGGMVLRLVLPAAPAAQTPSPPAPA